jgi:hypothetical protein
MSNLRRELLTLAEAARSLPKRPSPSTLWRWHSRGIGGVRLETIMIGGRRYVAREALQDFVARLTAAREPKAAACPPRPDDVRGRLEHARLL